MKKLSWVDKLLFLLNSIVAATLLLSNFLPYLSPKTFGVVSVFSLVVPILIVLNILFAIYWIIKLKKQFLVSTLVLLIGFNQLNLLYKIADKEILLTDDLKVMSYNVRLFNIYKWKKEGKEETLKLVSDFVESKNPDIICFQEFLTDYDVNFDFKYSYIQRNSNKKISYFGLAIFSKYKIINKGSLNFKESANNTIFVDIVKNKDTVRIYNVHLESQQIQLDKENFDQKNTERLVKRLRNTFQKQVSQAEQIVAHEKKCKYKTIVMGDFNNTAFSWAYHKIRADKNDAFVIAGKGLGKSYDHLIPLRIDFILVDPAFEINNFKTYDIKYSDHFPIIARLGIK